MDAAGIAERIWQNAGRSTLEFQSKREDAAHLTEAQVLDQLVRTLLADPSLFLEKHGRFVDAESLKYFEPLRHVYEVDFFVRRIQAGQRPSPKTVRNRRYRAMLQLLDKNEYFLEEAMKERSPALWEQYIGRYLTMRERAAPFPDGTRLSEIVLREYDIDRLDKEARRPGYNTHMPKRSDDYSDEEEFESESDDDDDDDSDRMDAEEAGVPERFRNAALPVISHEERDRLRDDFFQLMQQQFLSGGDKDFDYTAVDLNEDYDDWQQSNADLSEKYFDAFDPADDNDDGADDSTDAVAKAVDPGPDDEDDFGF